MVSTKKAKLIILIFLLLVSINICAVGQDLTDREILIQLIEKFNYLESSIKRMEVNSPFILREIRIIDDKISINILEINNLLGKYKETVARWNILLGLFATFILGIFIWMWKKSYK